MHNSRRLLLIQHNRLCPSVRTYDNRGDLLYQRHPPDLSPHLLPAPRSAITLVLPQTAIPERTDTGSYEGIDHVHLLESILRCHRPQDWTLYTIIAPLMFSRRWMSTIYKRVSSRRWRPSSKSNHMASFFYNELRRALSEQTFGIARYEVATPVSAYEATASVTVLEGSCVSVTLTGRGYHLSNGQTFETIEDLLMSISPKYAQQRSDALFAKLRGLQ